MKKNASWEKNKFLLAQYRLIEYLRERSGWGRSIPGLFVYAVQAGFHPLPPTATAGGCFPFVNRKLASPDRPDGVQAGLAPFLDFSYTPFKRVYIRFRPPPPPEAASHL